ncbi:MAG: Holliday junction DNA helicase RuvA [Nitrospirae bacterium RBG_16_64_22]|nr:MAG: Holliday junction DNA helicase RuvA [Nitrospirae bacterium RBG_16_64_22]
MKETERLIGLDFGTKTIGVAVSDALGVSAHPVGEIRRTSAARDLDAVAGYVEEYEARGVVIGLPRNMNGTLGPAAEKVLAFVERLRSRLDVSVETWDERLTTAEAERVLIEADLSRKRRREVIDRMAAVLILQGWLDRRRMREAKTESPPKREES